MRCAHCKATDGVTVAHVRACASTPAAPARTDLQQALTEAHTRRVQEFGLGDLLALAQAPVKAPQAPVQRPVQAAPAQDAHEAMVARLKAQDTRPTITAEVNETCDRLGIRKGPKRRGPAAPKGPSKTLAALRAWTPGEPASDCPF